MPYVGASNEYFWNQRLDPVNDSVMENVENICQDGHYRHKWSAWWDSIFVC